MSQKKKLGVSNGEQDIFPIRTDVKEPVHWKLCTEVLRWLSFIYEKTKENTRAIYLPGPTFRVEQLSAVPAVEPPMYSNLPVSFPAPQESRGQMTKRGSSVRSSLDSSKVEYERSGIKIRILSNGEICRR